MGFWKKFFGEDGEIGSITPSDDSVAVSDDATGISYEDIPHTLDLGWYYSEGKNEIQMAKIAERDRATHLYVIGATGTGKTKFLEFLIQQDIEKRNGFGVIDPHGDLIEDIKAFLGLHCLSSEQAAEEIAERVVLIDPTDRKFTVTFNPIEALPNVGIAEQANELIAAFRKIWADSWGVRMEDLMRNSLIALGEAELTLTQLSSFLTDRSIRRGVLGRVSHQVAKEYFRRFDSLTDRAQITWIEPVMNKMNAFFADERIRHMFSSPKSSFNLREVMDRRRILLVKLDKGKLKDSADLLGSLVMAKVQVAAFSRSDVPQRKRVPFYLYIDEFQNFASDSFATILSEARKYGLSLVMAHQTLAQISPELRSLILGNTGIQVYFRVNRQDAQLLAKEAFEYSGFEVKSVHRFSPKYWSLGEEWELHTEELQKLSPRECYVKHKIEGGLIALHTVDVKPPHKTAGMGEAEFGELLRTYPFGQKYLVERERLLALTDGMKKVAIDEPEREKTREAADEPRGTEKPGEKPPEPHAAPIKRKKDRPEKPVSQEELLPDEEAMIGFVRDHPGTFVTRMYKELALSGYRGDKLKGSLIEKGLIAQEETRSGKRGRLAKVLALTATGQDRAKRVGLAGKGGDDHKRFQQMIREQAEVYDWSAEVEERIPRTQETVDVGLRKGDVRVAIEISSTTKAEHEMQNIRKCLEAGYDCVVSVCSEDKRLAALKGEAKKSFSPRELERIRFFAPSRIKDFLKSLSVPGNVSERSIVSGQISRQKQLMDMNEASEYLGIRKNTLYEWVIERKIPHVRVGRLLKFRREDLEAWLNKRTQQETDRDFL